MSCTLPQFVHLVSFAASPYLIAGLTAASPKRHWLRVPEKGHRRPDQHPSLSHRDRGASLPAEPRTVRFIIAVTGPVADPKFEAAAVRNAERFADKHRATSTFTGRRGMVPRSGRIAPDHRRALRCEPAIEQHLLAMLWSVNRAANVSVSRSSPMTPTGHLR